jgi:RHS repeat-associated protein
MRWVGHRASVLVSQKRRRRLPLILCAVLTAVYVPVSSLAVTPTTALAARELPAGQHAGGAPKQLPVDPNIGDIPSLRTQMSRTSYAPKGAMQATISASPMNYRDSVGAWQPIDDSLVVATTPGYAYRNRADAYVAELPADVGSAPVRYTQGGASVSLALLGAHGRGTTMRSTGTYASVLPGVAVRFTATSRGLHEDLVLSSAAAGSQFRFALTTSGVAPRASSRGGIDFVTPTGRVPFQISPPSISDSSGPASADTAAVSLSLGKVGAKSIVAVTVDPAWLKARGRQWPVTIDPDIAPALSTSCTLEQYDATENECGSTDGTVDVGWTGTNSAIRSALKFDVSSIPVTSDVLHADLKLYLQGENNSTATPIGLYQMNTAYTSTATWNSYDGTHGWTTAGGDYAASAAYTQSSVGGALGLYQWAPVSLVQGWVDGAIANDGLLLKEPVENVNNRYFFYSGYNPPAGDAPVLTVVYGARVGNKSFYTQLPFRIDDRTQVQVNPATGNMLLSAKDFHIEGTGLPLEVTRYFNSESAFGSFFGPFHGWSSLATDYATYGDWDGSFALQGADDAIYAFSKSTNTASTWSSPAGGNITPSFNGGTQVYTLKYNRNGETYVTNSSGQLATYKDRNGNTITVNSTVNGNGNEIISTVVDTQGRATTWTSDAQDRPIKIQDSYSPARSVLYNQSPTHGYMSSFQDASGKTTTFSYYGGNGPNGVMNQIDTPEGRRTIINYDSAGKVTSLVRVTNKTNNTGPTWSFSYSFDSGKASGSTVVTDPNGHQTTYAYNTESQVTSVTDGLGHAQSTHYSPNGDADKLTGATSSTDVTTLTYSQDGNNNLTQYQEPATASGQTPASTSFGYSAPNQTFLPSSTTDAQSNCRAFVYDTAGNLTDTYDGQSSPCDGHTTGSHFTNAYQGDGSTACGAKTGELCSTTDAKANRTAYGYDGNGNLTSISPPSPLGATSIVPDALSRPSSVTDGKGQKTTYTYDGLDRVTQILYGGATTCVSSATCTGFVYDGDGNLTSRTDNTGTTTFKYDSLNRLYNKSAPSGFACSGSTPTGITFGYDANSNLTSYCDAGGSTTYGYDAANRLTALAEPGGSVTAAGACNAFPCTSFTYDKDNRREATTFAGGASLTAVYDGAGNEISVIGTNSSSAVLTSFTYTYTVGIHDKQLRQTMQESDATANVTYGYSYDAVNHLTQALVTAGTGTTYKYSYDANGNRCRTDGSACGAGDTYTYNTANELTASPGVSTYSYDANGNLSSTSSSGSFSYNAKNQTTAITYGGQTLSPLTYADVDQKERTMAGSTSFMSDAFGPTVSATSGSNSYFVRDNTGEVIGERASDGSHWYYLKDGIGSVVALVKSDGGTVGDRYGYDPYGNATSASGMVINPWRYASGYRDSTGLYKFGTRYYDPGLGRWTQEDPVSGEIARPSTANRYVYVNGNPVNYMDASGTSCSPVSGFFNSIGLTFGVLGSGIGILGLLGVVSSPVGWAGAAIGVIGLTYGFLASASC